MGLHRRLHLDRLHREDAARDKAQEAVDEVDARAHFAVPVAWHGHIRAAERNQSPEQIALLAFRIGIGVRLIGLGGDAVISYAGAGRIARGAEHRHQ